MSPHVTFERVVALLTLMIVAATFLVYYRQAAIMKTQADISKEQARIADEQRLISSRQLQLSARPYVSTRIESNPKDVAAERIVIRNEGGFPVNDLRLNYIYFVKIVGKGWYASVPTGGLNRKDLVPGEEWPINVVGYGKMLVPPPFAASFSIQGNLQFLVFLISFKREVDGHGYVLLEPMHVQNGKIFSQREMPGGPTENISGPLGHTCHPAIELSFEYLRRRPFPGNYEVYNYEYLLGYQPTGCLGPITWVK